MAKTVMITGASAGIGKVTAEMFWERGWNVVATMRNPQHERAHPRWITPPLDVLNRDSIDEAVKDASKRFGGIDVLVNNAGYGLSGVLEATTEEQFQRQMDTNVNGVIRCTQAVLPLMRQRGGGVIVNLSSVAGRVCFPFFSIYHASKWAVEGFSESLQFELEPHNIKVRLIEPGVIRTDFYSRSADVAYNPALKAYTADFERVSARMKKLESGGASPEDVAETIFNAATASGTRMRYPVGRDAQQLISVRRWMGDRAVFAAIRGRLFK